MIKNWKRIYKKAKRRITYENIKTNDIISIETLEVGLYQSKPKYRVKFNKFVLGIFKTKVGAISFTRNWMRKHPYTNLPLPL